MIIFVSSSLFQQILSINLREEDSILCLKTLIYNKTNIQISNQLLSLGGFPLHDNNIVSNTLLRNESTVELTIRILGGMSQTQGSDFVVKKPTDLQSCEAFLKNPLRNQRNDRIVREIRRLKDGFLEKLEFELYPDKKIYQESFPSGVQIGRAHV